MFGIFEMGGNILGSAMNKAAQDAANAENKRQFDEQMAYTKERDSIADERYNEELKYNRTFAANERAFNRAFALDERSYQRALQQEIFDREDTAITRQASQLAELGINPLTQNLNGLGAGSVVSSPSAPSTSAPSSPGHSNASMPSAPHMDAYTGWNFSGLEPTLDFLNQLDNLHTSGVQRDLLRQQENYQKLVNMNYANDNDITLDSKGNPIGITKTISNQKMREEEYKDKKASANRNKRVDDMQFHTGATDRTSNMLQPAYDASWQAYNVATGIKNAYDNHIDKANKKSDSKIATLRDRLADVGNKYLTNVTHDIMVYKNRMASWFKRKNRAIEYGSIPDRSGRMR